MFKNSDYDISNNLCEVSSHGFKMLITKRFKEYYNGEDYEKLSVDVFSLYAKKDCNIVDIGSHYGFYSLVAGKNGANVFAFEPVRENFEILEKNIKLNKFENIRAFNFAVSNTEGDFSFNIAEASDSSGFYEHPMTKTLEKRIVHSISVDTFLADKKIDLIKIDTEGHEIEVLSGMRSVIDNNSDIKLLIEFNPKCLAVAGKNPTDLLALLVSYGFDIFFLKDKERKIVKLNADLESWKEIVDPKGFVNIFCAKKDKIPFISFVSHSADMGGAERSLLDIVDSLLKRGIFSHIILPAGGPLEKELLKKVISHDISDISWCANIDKEKADEIKLKIFENAFQLAVKINKINPDIIFTNTSVINEGAIAAKILGVPHIWRISEFGKKEHGINYIFTDKERIEFINEYSNKIFFISESLKNYYIKNGIDEKKCAVIPNMVKINENILSTEKFFKSENSIKIANLGTVCHGKGQKDVVLAVKEIIKNDHDIELIFAGYISDKEYFKKIEDIIRKKNIQNKIKFIGYIDNPSSFINQADFIVVCSTSEGFGRVTAEAMLQKKPVIGANSGATPELIKDGINGFLYEPGNFNELADKISYFIKNKEKIADFGENGHAFIKNTFDEKNIGNKLISELFELKEKNEKKNVLNKDIYKILEILNIKNTKIKQKDQEIQQKDREIQTMKMTKAWKLASSYVYFRNQIRFILLLPMKFIKKYFKL